MANRRPMRASRPRSRVEWSASFNNDFVALAANSVAVVTSSNALLAALSEMTSPTVVRIRGAGIVMVESGSNTDDIMVGQGIAVVSTKAAGVGVTAVPSPLTDVSFPWMWHRFTPLRFFTTSGAVSPDAGVDRFEIDVKAMRKILSDEEELIYVVETSNGAGTAAIVFANGIRVLIKQT